MNCYVIATLIPDGLTHKTAISNQNMYYKVNRLSDRSARRRVIIVNAKDQTRRSFASQAMISERRMPLRGNADNAALKAPGLRFMHYEKGSTSLY